ncbi:hypothetical protein KFL_003720070 [Klebsormidium nitens]|uniref:Condensin complex subunit 1 C-terminal domain-containing protein n=1 Tax=Klebsormidium nitens TaxID=105231 RepID=A0A1Y1IG32_KLENI|nr:hypothetical protein KFL_003720070 [Klebsormidium nitens]|eukprot:GAQ87716.1 hypothetical protein KFL_003720070 [Klebsormidium nitens]
MLCACVQEIESSAIFDGAQDDDADVKQDPFSKLRPFLREETRDQAFNFSSRAFIQKVIRYSVSTELRVCIFFICHLVKITDASLASGKEDKDTSGRRDWLDTKASAVSFLSSVSASLTKVFSKGRDIEEAAELVERSALDIVIGQNWAEVLHVVVDSEPKCGVSLLSRVVDVVICKTNAAKTDKMALLQDHIEAGMAVLTKYADRESGAQILAAFLGGYDGNKIEHSGAPQQRFPSEKHQKLVLQAFNIISQLQSRELTKAEVLGALKVIVFLMAPQTPVSTRMGDQLHSLVLSVRWSAQLHGSVEENESTLDGNDCLKWSLKTCATVSRKLNIKTWTEAEDLLRLHFVSLYPSHKEEVIELLYSMGDPLRLSEEILRAYVEAGVFTSPQHLGTLVHFVQWIGDMSRNYKTAETLFLSQMRDSRHVKERRTSRLEDGFDYMDEEDEKANEEGESPLNRHIWRFPFKNPQRTSGSHAVQHFAASLLAGDSVPGCYVPVLAHLASNRELPTLLRTAAVTSLGSFLLLSPDLAKQHKHLVQDLLREGAPEMKLAALEVASKLVLQAPNEYTPVFETIQQLLLNSDVKETAYCVFAELLLQQKLRAHVYLGAITAGLVDSSARIQSLMVFVLQRLLEDSGRARYKIVVDAYKQSAPEVRTGLLETLLDGFLDEKDLKADDLASHVLQLLVLGTEGAAEFAAHLSPSAKVLQQLDAHVQACPPRISLSNDPESVEALCKFVANHRKHSSATTASKDLVNRLLDHFQKKTRRRKRRAEISTAPESSSLGAIEEYARAVDAFNEKADASSIYEIIGDG